MIRSNLLKVGVGGAAGVLYSAAATQVSPISAGAAFVGVGSVAAVLAYPEIGYLLSAAMVPMERFGRLTNDSSMFTFSLMRLLGVLTLGAFLLQQILTKRKIVIGLPCFLYAAYTCLAVLTLPYSSDFSGTVRACGQLMSNLLFFFVVINLTRSFRLADLGMNLCLAVTIAIAGFTVYGWYYSEPARGEADDSFETADRWSTIQLDIAEWDGGAGGAKRAMGSTSHPAVYGINLIVTIPFLAALLRRRQSWITWGLLWLGLLLVLYNVLLTNTRATILFATFTVFLCWVRGLLVVRMPVLFALAAAAMFYLPFMKSSSLDRILNLNNYTVSGSSSLRIRLSYYAAGLEVFQDNWLFGIGMGNKNEIPKYINEKTAKETSVHNEYLQTLMEVGLVGFAIYVAFLGVLLYQSFAAEAWFRRNGDDERIVQFLVACQIAMISTLIYGVQVDVFHFPLKGWWYVAGVTAAFASYAARPAAKLQTS